MNVVNDLRDASVGGKGCKVCDFLDTLTDQEDIQTDELIRAKSYGRNKISADRVSAVLKAHGSSVGATTVSRHRSNCTPRTADTQS